MVRIPRTLGEYRKAGRKGGRMTIQAIAGFDEGLIPLILDSIPVAVTLIDPDGRILHYNAYSTQILERRQELLGTEIRDCHNKPESIARIDQMLQAFRDGRREEFVYENERFGRRLVFTLKPFFVEGQLFGILQSAIIKP
jgi:PAS domain S-box-containing protein